MDVQMKEVNNHVLMIATYERESNVQGRTINIP